MIPISIECVTHDVVVVESTYSRLTAQPCIYKALENEGIKTLIDLLRENEVEMDRNRKKRIQLVLSAFPRNIQEVAMKFTSDIDLEGEVLTHILDGQGTKLIPINEMSTKVIQAVLKTILKKTEQVNFAEKLGVNVFELENIMKFRESCKNTRLRNIYFRAIHNDLFSNERMKRFKMVESDKCNRCDEVESSKHLLWECIESRRIWNLYNKVIKEQTQIADSVLIFDDIFKMHENKVLNMIKVKIIQQLIQIIRPVRWTENKITEIIIELRKIEWHNSNILYYKQKHNIRWEKFRNIRSS